MRKIRNRVLALFITALMLFGFLMSGLINWVRGNANTASTAAILAIAVALVTWMAVGAVGPWPTSPSATNGEPQQVTATNSEHQDTTATAPINTNGFDESNSRSLAKVTEPAHAATNHGEFWGDPIQGDPAVHRALRPLRSKWVHLMWAREIVHLAPATVEGNYFWPSAVRIDGRMVEPSFDPVAHYARLSFLHANMAEYWADQGNVYRQRKHEAWSDFFAQVRALYAEHGPTVKPAEILAMVTGHSRPDINLAEVTLDPPGS